MKQNDFYEVDGCMDFIPVKLIEEHKHMVDILEVEVAESGFKIFVPSIYRFKERHEPQKPVIPKFVSDWVEAHKGDYNKWDEEAKADFVFRSINDLFRFGEGLSHWDFTIDEKFSEWTTKNAYKFITAILFGYEIEQEKLYTVEIPNPNIIGNERTVLVKNGFNQIVMVRVYGDNWRTDKGYRLTESEIKQDFGWAWQRGE